MNADKRKQTTIVFHNEGGTTQTIIVKKTDKFKVIELGTTVKTAKGAKFNPAL